MVACRILSLLLCLLGSGPGRATVPAPKPPPEAARVYLNPNTGRFWTMDSYEGNDEDPLTLHKYLYCRANPFNRIDPTGLADYLLAMSYSGTRPLDPETFADIYTGTVYGNAFRDHSIAVSLIGPKENIYNSVTCAIEAKKLVAGTDRITKIIIVGHGIPGQIGGDWRDDEDTSDFTLDKITKPNTPHAKLLAYMKPFTDGHCEVELRACDQADPPDGQKFMLELSKALGASVTGYDDTYAIKGWGNRYTAYADGRWELTEKRRPHKGSWADPGAWISIWDAIMVNWGLAGGAGM